MTNTPPDLALTSRIEKDWEEEFKFGNVTVCVSKPYSSINEDAFSNPEDRLRLAEQLRDFRIALLNTYGSNVVSGQGPATGVEVRGSKQTHTWFGLGGLDVIADNLKKTIISQNSMTPDIRYRLERRTEESIALFTIYSTNGCVIRFPNKTSPRRAAAKAVDPTLVAKFDAGVGNDKDSYAWMQSKPDYLKVDELTLALKAMKKTALETLKAVGADASDANASSLIQLMHAKSRRVVKESLVAMPFLKVDSQIDKNLARMVGRGLTYERLLIFGVADNYPTDSEELDVMIVTPHAWLFKMLA